MSWPPPRPAPNAPAPTAPRQTPRDQSAAVLPGSGHIVVLRDGKSTRDVIAAYGIHPRSVYNRRHQRLHRRAFGRSGEAAAGGLGGGVRGAERARAAVRHADAGHLGIDRVDQHVLPLSNSFSWTAAGRGVRIYVLDTGVRRTHAEPGTRASYIPGADSGNFVCDAHGSAADRHGHGTHVPGTPRDGTTAWPRRPWSSRAGW